MTTDKTVKLNNVSIFWSKHNRVDDYSGKYQMDVVVNDAQAERLGELGVSIKNKGDDRGNFITVKSKFPIPVVDTNGNDLSEESIGNGTKAVLTILAKPWKFAGKQGVSTYPKFVQITDLVAYAGGSSVDEEL